MQPTARRSRPSIVLYVPLRTVPSVVAVTRYLADAEHADHRGYTLQRVAGPDGLPPERLIAKTLWAWSKLEIEYSAHLPTTMFYWWMVCLAPYSWASGAERETIEKAVLPLVAHGGHYFRNWHIDRIAGAADLNIVVPNVSLSGVPFLNRLPALHLPAAAQLRLAAAINAINAARREQGRVPMVTLGAQSQSKLQRGLPATLEQDVAKRSLKLHVPATGENLAKLLTIPRVIEWGISPRRNLKVVMKSATSQNTFQVPLARFLEAVAWQIDRLRSCRYSRKKLRGHSAPWGAIIAPDLEPRGLPAVARTIGVLRESVNVTELRSPL